MQFSRIIESIAVIAVIGALAMSATPAQGMTPAHGITKNIAWTATVQNDAAARTIVLVQRDEGEYRAVRKGDELIITLNGEPLSEDRIERDGRRIRILNADGERVASLTLGANDNLTLRTDRQRQPRARRGARVGAGAFGGGGGPDVPRGRIGVTLGTIDEALAGHLGLDPNEVVLITNVVEGGGADEAGLKKHDIIVAVDGKDSVTASTIREVVRAHKPGESLEIEVIRAGERKTLQVTVQPVDERAHHAPEWIRQLEMQGWDWNVQRLLDKEEMQHIRDMADTWQERAQVEAAEFARKLLIDVELEQLHEEAKRQFGEYQERARKLLERRENEIKHLRDEIEREVRSLLEETEPIEEKLEQLLDGIEERIKRLIDESRSPFGFSQQMQIIEDEDGGKSIVVRPRRGGFGGGGVGVPPRDRMEAEQPRRRQIGGGGGVMPRERPQRDQAAERLDRLEQRLDRIERMLEQLMER